MHMHVGASRKAGSLRARDRRPSSFDVVHYVQTASPTCARGSHPFESRAPFYDSLELARKYLPRLTLLPSLRRMIFRSLPQPRRCPSRPPFVFASTFLRRCVVACMCVCVGIYLCSRFPLFSRRIRRASCFSGNKVSAELEGGILIVWLWEVIGCEGVFDSVEMLFSFSLLKYFMKKFWGIESVFVNEEI